MPTAWFDRSFPGPVRGLGGCFCVIPGRDGFGKGIRAGWSTFSPAVGLGPVFLTGISLDCFNCGKSERHPRETKTPTPDVLQWQAERLTVYQKARPSVYALVKTLVQAANAHDQICAMLGRAAPCVVSHASPLLYANAGVDMEYDIYRALLQPTRRRHGIPHLQRTQDRPSTTGHPTPILQSSPSRPLVILIAPVTADTASWRMESLSRPTKNGPSKTTRLLLAVFTHKVSQSTTKHFPGRLQMTYAPTRAEHRPFVVHSPARWSQHLVGPAPLMVLNRHCRDRL